MKYFLPILMMACLYGCGTDTEKIEMEISGTWILSNVSGSCAGLPLDVSGNPAGCIDLPTLELNCLMLRFDPAGALTYTQDQATRTGTYEIKSNDEIEICMGTCYLAAYDGSTIQWQTGTLPLCDPIYQLTPSDEDLDALVLIYSQKRIKSYTQNGVVRQANEYHTDGSIKSQNFYNQDGNLTNIYAFTHTPISTTLLRTVISAGAVYRYEYYLEAPGRLRRDLYIEGQGTGYRLYFYGEQGECWITRREDYSQAGELQSLLEYRYTGDNCGVEVRRYQNGELRSIQTIERDGRKHWADATLIPLLKYQGVGNTSRSTFLIDNEVVESESYTSTFTYDAADYPTTEIRSYLDGTSAVLTFDYHE